MVDQNGDTGGFSPASLDKIFRARSVAIVGASPQAGSPRNTIVRILIKHGFSGKVFPVARSHTEIEGRVAYPTLADLPETPDVALIITPAETVPGIIEECGLRGIASAVVFSAGFEETEGGKEIAAHLAAAAKKYNVAVFGANSQGAWSVKAKTILTFGAAANALTEIKYGPVAVISQSGALMGGMGANLQRSGVGCCYLAAVGNETCIDALDVLAWMVEQDDVRVIVLYLEGIANGRRLIALAARARIRRIQIVTLKAGRSRFGQEATASHTGKIASPYAIYRDVLAQAGIIVVESLSDAMAAAEALAVLPDPRVSGDPLGGIAVISSSGGAGALLADHAEERGLPMTEFSADALSSLQRLLPEFARSRNPIDLTGQVVSDKTLFRKAMETVSADPRTEAIVIQFASGGMRDLRGNADVFKAFARDSGLPLIITFAAETLDPLLKAEFREAGILLSDDPFSSMRALRWIYDRRQMAGIEVTKRAIPSKILKSPESWSQAMSYLSDCTITPVAWRILAPNEQAESACVGMNWPLVVKALPSEAEHKTELGLVKLRVLTPQDVDAHAASFRRMLNKPGMDVLVQEMMLDGVEVVLSCLRHTDFGPVLSIGSGGVAIELYRDVAYLALPVTRDQVLEALRKTKLWMLLQGFRGQPLADIDALVSAAVMLGDMFLATPDAVELEINPVLVRAAGKGLAAVDCLVVPE